MTTATRRVPSASRRASPSAVRDLALGALPLAAVSSATCWLLGVPTSHVLHALGLYLGLAAVVLWRLPWDLPASGIGPANRVTLARVTLVLPVTALALRAGPLPLLGYWWVLALATVAMVLDGVDGLVARRTGSQGAFGARFDMEVDALLLLALSGLLWQSGKAGPWVLLIGALRYLFVLAGAGWPALRQPLPPRSRRKAICVVQGVALVAGVAPIVPGGLATVVAAVALVLLGYSFAVDVWWLAQARSR